LKSHSKGARDKWKNHANQSPSIPKWSALFIEAVTKPGLIMKAYSAFQFASDPARNADLN